MTPAPGTFHDENEDERADAPSVPLVNGISQADWNRWHANPVTITLRKYLRDLIDIVDHDVVQHFRARKLTDEYQHQQRGKIWALDHVETLMFDNVVGFYEEKE